MKKILMMAALLVVAQFAKAQTEKGNQTLGVNFQFSHASGTSTYIDPFTNSVSVQDQKTTNFYIGPTYSYFIANNLDLGASVQYNTTHSSIGVLAGEQKQTNSGYGGTVFLRKYFMYQNKIGLRAGPYATYGHTTFKYSQVNNPMYDQNTSTNNYGGGVNAEIVYYPTKQLGVALSLANINYNYYSGDSGARGSNSGDSFNASFINSGLNVSVYYTFGK